MEATCVSEQFYLTAMLCRLNLLIASQHYEQFICLCMLFHFTCGNTLSSTSLFHLKENVGDTYEQQQQQQNAVSGIFGTKVWYFL